MLLSVSDFMGRFHPVLVHLPIGILMLALILQWLSVKPAYALSPSVIRLVWWAGIAGALLACITGYLLSLTEDYDEDVVNLHMWMGISVAAISLFVASRVFIRRYDLLYKAASILLFIVIIITGHFGGVLTHGSDYLTAGLFGPDAEEPEVESKPIPDIQEAAVYTDVIQPLFQSKCYSCHSDKKQKGKLRLDKPEYIIKGGKNGEVIVNGNADNSELIKRLLLPPEDEHHMPPRQKPQLRESQVELIHWWIESGAAYDKKVKDIQQPDKIKTLLTSLEAKKNTDNKLTSLYPEQPVEAASEKAIQLLKDKGVIVMPVAAGSNYLTANFVTAPTFSDEDITLLLPLKSQLVSLKAGSTRMGDSSMKTIAACSNIRFLQLNNTAVTDNGVAYLQALTSLQSLNLVGTAVTYRGLQALQKLKNLAHIYTYKTNIKSGDYAILKTTFPRTTIDTGGYSLPSLASDTSYLTKPKED